MSALPILADVDWFYVAELYALKASAYKPAIWVDDFGTRAARPLRSALIWMGEL